MRRKEDFPIVKHTINLYSGDFQWLQHQHGRVGAGKVIRELVRAHRRRAEARASQRIGTVSELDFDPIPNGETQ